MGESKELWWKKNIFLCVFKKIRFKHNDKPAHWVGHSTLISLDINDFFKRTPKFYENQSSITGNTEDKENAPEENNDDANENEESNEINDFKKSFII